MVIVQVGGVHDAQVMGDFYSNWPGHDYTILYELTLGVEWQRVQWCQFCIGMRIFCLLLCSGVVVRLWSMR